MLIYRLNNGVSLFRPAYSICPQCHERLHWFELLPVLSFLRQRGVCASCGARIPRRYPALELVFILTALVLGAQYAPPQLWPRLVLFWFVWALVFSDILYQEIPYSFSAGFGLALLPQGLHGTPASLAVWLFLFLLIKTLEKFYYKKPVLGGADLLLFFLLALYFPLAKYVLALYLTFGLGLLAALTLLALRKAGRGSLIPFTPFILLAFTLTEYWGGVWLKFYGF
jgi:prepilin signal peptidase PulO-like enzyme (type II secretory pathway)